MNNHYPENDNTNIPANSASSDQAAAAAKALELWARHSAGEPLAHAEAQWLQTHWQACPSTRQRIADEQWIDRLLRLQAETPSATEAFVQQVLQRCPPTPPVDLARNNAAKKTAPTLRWGWLIAAALLVGLTATGIWYQASPSSQRPDQANSQALAPPGDALAQTSPTPQPVAPNTADDGLPTLDPSITAQLEPRSSPLDPAANVVARPAAPVDEQPSTDPLGADTRGPLLATISRVGRPSERPGERPSESARQPRADELPEAWREGQRLGARVLQVNDSDLQLTMASGAVVDVFAPSRIELIGENALQVWQGEIATQVPPAAVGFQVHTPIASVTDLGTTFDVLVDPSGVTEIEVRGGQVSVATHEPTTQQQWLLTADDTYNLTLYSSAMPTDPNIPAFENNPPESSGSAVASRLRHVSGRITGVVAFDGRSLQFDDETVFDTVRDRLFHGLQSSEASLLDTWSQFVAASSAGRQPQGQLRLNDQEFNFGNFNEAIKAQTNVMAQFAPDRKPPPPAAGPELRLGQLPNFDNFRGSLMIDGKRRDFDSWDEYRAAMKELLGPLAEFGAFPFLP